MDSSTSDLPEISSSFHALLAKALAATSRGRRHSGSADPYMNDIGYTLPAVILCAITVA
jgi:hypothetical protein